MSAAILSLLASNWQAIAGVAGAAFAALALYFKGRSDAAAKAKLADLQSANKILKDGFHARETADNASRNAGTGGLPDDGWRRKP